MGIKVEEKSHRIVVMAMLLVVSCLMTYYFHKILGLGTIFTHFFYIPIILASIWWKRRGLLVAAFLAAVLIFGHLVLRKDVLNYNDYHRAVMFIVIAFVVAWLSEQIVKKEERIEHLNLVLRAIRNVNQLITNERNRDKLLKGACENLVETRGYYNAWIALLDEFGKLVKTSEAGLDKDFLPMVKRLKSGKLTACGQEALKRTEVVSIVDPSSTCGDCPLVEKYAGRGAMTIRLEYRGKIYGLLSASVPRDFIAEEEKQALFNEIARDIAFALHNIKMEEERKKTEEQIKASLKEKEVLLREIHHRVKNNLQVISSLLKLQSQYIEDKHYVDILKESQNRIKSMSLIHEMLYQSKHLSKINFKEYIRTLANYLLRSCWDSPRKIALKIDSENVYLPVDNAIPCGLIINELVSNSLKHAYPDGKEGEIKIALHSVNEGDIELVVSDDGVGIPEDLDIRNTKSLGLHLVTILAEDQLHGEIKLDRKKGTEFQIKLRGVK